MTRTQQATAVAVFDPVEAGRNLSRLVENRRPQLAALMGIEDPESDRGRAILERFVTVALHAATSRPDILQATPESLVESIRDAAMLGLEPVGAMGDGSIVVYRENGVPTAHFQPMYRGLLKLARRSGDIASIDAHVVYAGDVIEIDLGSNPSVRHAPALDGGKRGGFVGAYAVAELRNGRRYVDWMTLADIEVVRSKSRARDAMAWADFWPEMARKTVLRRLMKRLPLESLAEHALGIENEAEDRAEPPAPAVASSPTRSRLQARFAPPTAEPEPEPIPAAATVAATEPQSVCGAPSPNAEGEGCELEPGHGGPHGDGGQASWL